MSVNMIDVKHARDLEEFKRQTFINFHNIRQRLSDVDEFVLDPDTKDIKTTTGSGGNVFNIVYLGDKSAYIYQGDEGDLILHDKYAGDVKLIDIKTAIDRFWEYGDAYGPKAQTAAGTETWIGSMEDSDGVTNFNSPGEVE